jgi:hypothetical protein
METSSESKTITMSFNVVGKNLTHLIRTCWIEGRILPALDIIESSGCPEHFWLDVFTGKVKMEGQSKDDTLHIERDNTTMHENVDISFEAMNNRMIKELKKHSIMYANADARMRYWPFRMDIIGASYKTGKLGVYRETDENTFAKDKRIVESSGKILAELEPFFKQIYALKGLSIVDIDWSDVTESIQEFDYYHPAYLPEMKRIARTGESVPSTNLKTEFGLKNLDNMVENDIMNGTVIAKAEESKKQIDKIKEERKHEKITPFGLEIPEVTNAWIDRNGNFYGDFRDSIMFTLVHIEMGDRFIEDGIIPEELNVESEGNPSRYLEMTGWLKLSANQFYYLPRNEKLKVSSAQLKTVIKYAKIRGLDHINTGYFMKNVPIKDISEESFQM